MQVCGNYSYVWVQVFQDVAACLSVSDAGVLELAQTAVFDLQCVVGFHKAHFLSVCQMMSIWYSKTGLPLGENRVNLWTLPYCVSQGSNGRLHMNLVWDIF